MKETINELFKNLGYDNVSIIETPLFHWNGESITNEKTDSIKTVNNYMLNNEYNFLDFLNSNRDKKIHLLISSEGKLIYDNMIRAFVA